MIHKNTIFFLLIFPVDWPLNNFYAARPAGGPMRFYLWDAEGAMNIYNQRPPNTYDTFSSDLSTDPNNSGDYMIIPVMYSLLKDAPEFKLKW